DSGTSARRFSICFSTLVFSSWSVRILPAVFLIPDEYAPLATGSGGDVLKKLRNYSVLLSLISKRYEQ
ncbi:MAG: hypothetical protein PHC90_11985, partial [Syntrophorhabdaceae bacterium]|nr:hypothetical protein [Syntrophorhabdaceae bacterium]